MEKVVKAVKAMERKVPLRQLNITRKVIHGNSYLKTSSSVLAVFPGELSEIMEQKLVPEKSVGVRKRAIPRKGYPSVSTVLKSTMEEAARERLEMYIQKRVAVIGLDGYKQELLELATTSTVFHSLVSGFLESGKREWGPGIDTGSKVAGFCRSVEPLLWENGLEPMGSEAFCGHPVLCYNGRYDALLKYKDAVFLVDWKAVSTGSSKQKLANEALEGSVPMEKLFDDPIQLAAYVGAVNSLGKQKVEKAMLVLCHENGDEATVVELGKAELEEAWATWTSKLLRFWTRLSETPLGETVDFVPDLNLTTHIADDMFQRVPSE